MRSVAMRTRARRDTALLPRTKPGSANAARLPRLALRAPRVQSIPPPLIEAELERIAASSAFRRSARHVRFIRHLVACTLAGEAARLREMALGVDVFHRSAAGFDPRRDSIARVEARRLRDKLARYYAGEGRDAPLRFELPVGRYEIGIRRHRRAPDATPAHGEPAAARAAREALDLARISLRQNSIDGKQRAQRLAEEAIRLDPGCASAHWLLALALIGQTTSAVVPAGEAMEAARQSLQRALALDDTLADAHGELGIIAFAYDRDWPAAQRSLRRAMQLAPDKASSHARWGHTLMMNRRFDEARSAYAEATTLDPLSLQYRAQRALVDLYARDFDAARAGFLRVLDSDPSHLLTRALLAALDLYCGRATAARAAYATLAEQLPQWSLPRCGLAQADALLGETARARDGLAWLLDNAEQGYVSPYQVAMVQVRLREHDAAIDWLARAAELRDPNVVCMAVDPALDALRPLPRFRELLVASGLGHLADMV